MANVSEKSLDLINQGCALMAQENYPAALELFQKAAAEAPDYVECYINLGNVYSCMEDYDAAMENFKKALLLDSNSVEVLFDLGNVYYLKGDTLEAVKYYNRAEETGELTSDMCDMIAAFFLNNEDPTQALRYLNRAIQLEPLRGEYYITKAGIFIDQNKPEEAEETLETLNKLLPDAFEGYDLLAQIYLLKGEFDRAYDLAERGVTRFPEDGALAHLKLKVLSQSGKNDEAFRYVEEMKQKGLFEERKADNTLILAQLYAMKGDLAAGAACIEECLNGEYTENAHLSFILLTFYFKDGKYEEVIKVTEGMMKDEEADIFAGSSAQFYHAQALMHIGQEEQALEEFRRITKEFRKLTISVPSFYEGYVYRLLAHRALKEYDEALSLADYMVNLFPDRPDGHAFKHIIYQDLGQNELAEEERKLANDLDPNFAF